ncbi:MAG: dTMP kinase [Bacteriovoracaceae bacterium]|nr:dTMP kinase [Bacteroidota bacterium]
MFLSFEGIDCCGKTTQAKLLVEKLQSVNNTVLFLREPGGTEISEQIRQILLNKKNLKMTQITELLLFSASRSQLVTEVIKPAIAKGTIVITDRFVDSTTAYQGYGRGLHHGGVKSISSIATSGLMPRKTFFIDIPVQEMYSRRLASHQEIDRMEMSNEDFYHRVREGYVELAKEEPGRIVTIDGRQPIDTIHETIWKEVDGMLHTVNE